MVVGSGADPISSPLWLLGILLDRADLRWPVVHPRRLRAPG